MGILVLPGPHCYSVHKSLNPMPDASVSSSRWNKALILCGVLLGVIGFFLGRFTVQQNAPPIASGTTDNSISPAIAAKESVGTPVPPRAEPGRVLSSPGWNEKQWQQAVSKPVPPARNATLANLLEKLAAVDPTRAMTIAQAEGNLKLREALLKPRCAAGRARHRPTPPVGRSPCPIPMIAKGRYQQCLPVRLPPIPTVRWPLACP